MAVSSDEKRAWDLLIKSNITPSRWRYIGSVGGVQHRFVHLATTQEIILVDPGKEAECRKPKRSFMSAERSTSKPPTTS